MIELSSSEHADNEQQRLLDVIWHDESPVRDKSGFEAQGIDIYRRNLLANAQRALSISFPTVFQRFSNYLTVM